MSKRKRRLFKYYDDGEITPPSSGTLHSSDINRSSQDTQPPRASQTEPVRHGVGGGSTTRHRLAPLALARAINDRDYCIFRGGGGITNSGHLWGCLFVKGQVSKFRVCHLFRDTPPSPNFNCPVSARWLISPDPHTHTHPPPTQTVSAAKVPNRPQQTNLAGRQAKHSPLAGK